MAGNPDIAQYAEGKRFGDAGGADPAEAGRKAKPWSIRNQVRYLAAQQVDENDENAYKPKGRMTRAQRIALKTLQKAEEGDMRAIEYATDQIDGKLVQPTLNADLAAIQTMSDEELYELAKQLESATSAGAGTAGATETTGQEGAATGDAAGDGAETSQPVESKTTPTEAVGLPQ